MTPLPEPPAPSGLTPELETLPAGTRLARVHGRAFREVEFNPYSHPAARFRPIGNPVVPTLYAGEDADVALAEGLFHDVPIRPDALREYALAGLEGRVLSELATARDLTLIQLRGYGLQRLGLTHGELIESPAAAYPWTARWAGALHTALPRADGLIWMSRRFTGRTAALLWGDRVTTADLAVVAAAIPLWEGPGRELVLRAAKDAGIRLIM